MGGDGGALHEGRHPHVDGGWDVEDGGGGVEVEAADLPVCVEEELEVLPLGLEGGDLLLQLALLILMLVNLKKI